MIRIGHGFDVHRFGGEGPIIIGGVKIPYEQGLIAHSDGDVALHALSDALLGAIAAGDIGRHFPDTDDKWKGQTAASSSKMCIAVSKRKVMCLVMRTSLSLPKRRKWPLYSGDVRGDCRRSGNRSGQY